jgi:hypothetical protein
LWQQSGDGGDVVLGVKARAIRQLTGTGLSPLALTPSAPEHIGGNLPSISMAPWTYSVDLVPSWRGVST